ncbi:transposase, partial [Alkalimonas collagenimarina]
MKLRNNDVWLLSGSAILKDGKYRLLSTLEQIDTLLLFPLDDQRLSVKPIALSVTTFFLEVKERHAKLSEYKSPTYLTRDLAELPASYLEKMERNFDSIKGLISNHAFLFEYATKQRSKALAIHASVVGRGRKELSRLLTNYWRNGQLKLALVPRYELCGGTGKEKTFSDHANGAPIKARTLAMERREKYVMKEQDRKIFRKVISSNYLKESAPSIKDVYEQMLDDYYGQEKIRARLDKRPPLLPSYKQFCYFLKNKFNKNEIVEKRTSEQDYLRNKRGILGVSTQRSALPGSVFEIDATVADVHIVSEFGPQYILGRPTIYIVIDRASRLIAGLHVSLYFASWRAARQALANSFLPKQEFCRLFGIDIAEAEWPCADLPLELVGDNGEMIGLEPTVKVSPMTQLSFNPPYRPDGKGVVEKRFDILNKKSIHKLMGTTRGGKVIRGDRDPRKDAVMTLSEVTRILILEVLVHNKSV